MGLSIQIVRQKVNNELRAVIGKKTATDSEVVAEVHEDAHGFHTLHALTSADTVQSVLLRKTLETLCLKMYKLGTGIASTERESSPPFPPP